MKKGLITGITMLCFASVALAQSYNIENVSKAIEDMSKDSRYPKTYSQELEKYKAEFKKGASKDTQAKFDKFAREALLQNPLVQETKDWLFIKRKFGNRSKGLPANWAGNASLMARNPKYDTQIDDAIYKMDITDPSSAKLFYKPTDTKGITDIEVDWDASKIMYSALNKNKRWQIYELDLKSMKRRILSIEKYDEIDYADSVYLQDGKIIFMSTANYAGVPCVNGKDPVSNIYKMDPTSDDPEVRDATIRQISFDQENSWSPTLMNDGKVMFTRWEYTDNSHYFSRILMKMNPDGSGQMSHYGSTSYWPNSLFYCRPIKGDANKFVAVVSGHHGVARSGELHLFDVSKGVIEDEGRVHQYLGMGKPYVAKMLDNLVGRVMLHFLHPYPLSENYIVVAFQNKTNKDNHFSLYLVDKFDNATLLYSAEKEGYDLMEPIPLAPREKPPLIADKVDEDSEFGYVFLNNIYEGPGLKGVEKGTVKKLRVFEYNYNYNNSFSNKGGLVSHETMGMESCWEIKRVHGTVDVEADGSAMFKVPANRPYSLQPLDKDGRALALFRSWVTVLAGETQSCVGCHEPSNTAPVASTALAGRKPPQTIKEFLGAPRGFSFDREVQPILDAYCVECHDGKNKEIPNLKKESTPWNAKNYSNSYLALHPFVRRPGPESNQNILSPLEFHASTSELIQLLDKGHKGVNMDEDSKKIIYTWIDLNVPYHGTLNEAYSKVKSASAKPSPKVANGIPDNQEEKRRFFLKKYANRDYNYEAEDSAYSQEGRIKFNKRGKVLTHKAAKTPVVKGFPFEAKEGKTVSVEVNGINLEFVQVPAGKFVQGSNDSFYDEGPALAAEVKKPFFMTKFEITNALFNEFNKDHFSGFLDRHWKDHINPGYPAHGANMPVIRVSYNEALEFCAWLSKKLKKKVSLPTETQWEWAARAGSDKHFWYGNVGDDFSKFENFSDKQSTKFAVKGVDPQPMQNPNAFYAYLPADERFDDGQLVPCYKDFENRKNIVEYKHLDCGHIAYAHKAGMQVTHCPTCGDKLLKTWKTSAKGGQTDFYKPNGFGLYDMAGNVAEWTLGKYTKTLNGEVVADKVVARGGSWADRPSFGKTTLRRAYSPWQKVYNVGFRVIIE